MLLKIPPKHEKLKRNVSEHAAGRGVFRLSNITNPPSTKRLILIHSHTCLIYFLPSTEVANIANCTFPIRRLGYISLENSLRSLKNARILYAAMCTTSFHPPLSESSRILHLVRASDLAWLPPTVHSNCSEAVCLAARTFWRT